MCASAAQSATRNQIHKGSLFMLCQCAHTCQMHDHLKHTVTFNVEITPCTFLSPGSGGDMVLPKGEPMRPRACPWQPTQDSPAIPEGVGSLALTDHPPVGKFLLLRERRKGALASSLCRGTCSHTQTLPQYPLPAAPLPLSCEQLSQR